MKADLQVFDPQIAQWFGDCYGEPTDIQAMAWPRIAAGEHTFVTAPTGSGKTLTAFLFAIQQLIRQRTNPARLLGGPVTGPSVLYVSPLKALNNDIERNLKKPLLGLRERYQARGLDFPPIEVLVRSGDTPQSERRRMLRRPPDILITTPESLNVLLAGESGRGILQDIRTVILDEIHNTAATKRGTYLISAVERLVRLSGEFQRIALSATVRPVEEVARFVAGYRLVAGSGDQAVYEPRPIAILSSNISKRYEVQVSFPPGLQDERDPEKWWPAIVKDLREVIAANRSTLVFANSRRMAEKITRLINEVDNQRLAYAHHGSLSKEIRLAVEQRLKAGELPAIVATGSLELGIDIGDVDQVVLLETPMEPSATIQRIGRSGHAVGETSRGRFLPIHSKEFLFAAAAARCVSEQSIEEVRIPPAPLDVLAQLLLAMCLDEEGRSADDLFDEIRTCSPYHGLLRSDFDGVVEMLTGRYKDRPVRELRPRLVLDGATGRLRSLSAVRGLIYRSGGVIPDRGYFQMRLAGSGERVGELDEEFVWERSLGDIFPMGNRTWRIARITHNDVEVLPADGAAVTTPFWKAEALNRGFFFSNKVGELLQRIDSLRYGDEAASYLQKQHSMSARAAHELLTFLEGQERSSGMRLPHTGRITAEVYAGARGSEGFQHVLHTFWGGRVNRPLALALAAVAEAEGGGRVLSHQTNDSILLSSPGLLDLGQLLRSLDSGNLADLLRQRLESTNFFGARFRENAQRALLIPRRRFGDRMPLWLSRMRAKRLLEAVSDAAAFPIIQETWNECLGHEFDLARLRLQIDALAAGEIVLEQAAVENPTPFAQEMLWQQTNTAMYADDAPEQPLKSNIDDELVRRAAGQDASVVGIQEQLVEELRQRVRRTAPGYAPVDAPDFLAHLGERIWMGYAEWCELLAAVRRDHGELVLERLASELADSVVSVGLPDWTGNLWQPASGERGAGPAAVLPRGTERLERLQRVLYEERDSERVLLFLQDWFESAGLAPIDEFEQTFRLSREQALAVLDSLVAARKVRSVILEGGREVWISAANFERLLRMRRRARRVELASLDVAEVPFFLSQLHGLPAVVATTGQVAELSLEAGLERLFAFPLPAEIAEAAYLVPRVNNYEPGQLERLFGGSSLVWRGHERRRISFIMEEDLPLVELVEPRASDSSTATERVLEQLRNGGRFSLTDLEQRTMLTGTELLAVLSELAWAGRVSCTHFGMVRRAAAAGFGKARVTGPVGRGSRWKPARLGVGYWFLLNQRSDLANVADAADDSVATREAGRDAMDRLEDDRSRARILLARYGIIFRELLQNETVRFRGTGIFRALRLMELSGEISGGRFVEGLSGWQFASSEAVRLLSQMQGESAASKRQVWWCNACDPVSACGKTFAGFQDKLPARIASNWMLYDRSELILVVRRAGEVWEQISPQQLAELEEGLLRAFCDALLAARTRSRPLVVRRIDSLPAARSPLAQRLRGVGFLAEMDALVLRRYGSGPASG